jgi:gliding motility-associated-like protein
MIFLKKLPHLVLIVIISLPLQVLAQQGNIWYFGERAGVNFNTTSPSSLKDGAISTLEGSSCISDNNGNLLFYTDGSIIYNKNHQTMPNGSGLLGDYSSAQSAIIIPKPGSTNFYYIFTASEVNHQYLEGYNYNVVDMNLNGGLGDVVQKNVLLFAPGTEKLTAVRHANGTDVWLMTKAPHSNIFKAYKIDCNGIDTNPVISTSGNVITSYNDYDDGGLLKFSPDGSKLCQTFGSKLLFQLYQFDNNTGIVSNSLQMSYPDSCRGDYVTVEFSPNSKLLYVGFTGVDLELYYYYYFVKVFQYDLSSYNLPAITSSENLLFNERQYYGGKLLGTMGQIQIGPDSKIYIARAQSLYLDAINNPNIKGTGCNYLADAVYLDGRLSLAGLPTFMPNLFVNRQSSIDYTINADCSTVNFTATTSIPGAVTWLWDFGDGTSSTSQNPVHTFSTNGNLYTVTLKILSPNACNGFVTLTKDVNLKRNVPLAGFYHQNQCGEFDVNFFDTSSITGGTINYRDWDFGDGTHSSALNPVHTYASIGNHTVKLTVGNTNPCGGNSIITKTVPIESQPTAAFSIKGACTKSPVQFTDLSTISVGTITEWRWNFGDGDTSSLKNPVHVFNDPGNYSITLQVRSQSGCWSTVIAKNLAVSNKPIAAFEWKDQCINLPVNFSDKSSIENGTIINWRWDFGDGDSSLLQNLQHSYIKDGNFTVKFFVSSSTGCSSDTVTKTITIGSKPVAKFTNTYQCGERNVAFSDASTASFGVINQWQWNFGDAGSTDSIAKPGHIFNDFNTYNVKLVVSSNFGCSSDTVIKKVLVDAKPVAAFIVPGGCVNQPVVLVDNSTIALGSINKWNWDFGDGSLSNVSINNKMYSTAGEYVVQLLVTGANNCVSDTLSKKVIIESILIASFTVKDGCAGKTLQLSNTSSIAYGNIEKYNWNFGNIATDTSSVPKFAFPSFGNYTVSLTVQSINGCFSSTISKPVIIESIPVAAFNIGDACAGKPVNFENNTINDFGAIKEWLWNFGNGDTSKVFQPYYTYYNYGTYNASLVAQTTNGCSSSTNKSIAIKKVEVYAGNDTMVAALQPLQLNAIGAKDYVWVPNSFLNNNSIYNPVAVLNNDFTYYLQAVTAEGCIGYDTLHIKVFKGSEIYVPTAFSPNGDGMNDILKPIIPGALSLEYFSVYNRWGQLVYSTSKLGNGWNGKANGVNQPQGAYVWTCRVKDYTGKIIERKGSVLLIH